MTEQRQDPPYDVRQVCNLLNVTSRTLRWWHENGIWIIPTKQLIRGKSVCFYPAPAVHALLPADHKDEMLAGNCTPLSVGQVAKLLGTHPNTVTYWRESFGFGFKLPSNAWRYPSCIVSAVEVIPCKKLGDDDPSESLGKRQSIRHWAKLTGFPEELLWRLVVEGRCQYSVAKNGETLINPRDLRLAMIGYLVGEAKEKTASS